MDNIEICRKITDLGRSGMRTLVYSLTRDGAENVGAGTQYGVRIEIAETGESAECRGITPEQTRAEYMLDLLASGCATPVTLYDIVYDMLL